MRIGSIQGIRAAGRISRADAGRYAFELLIVFVGVYLAVLVTNYQEELQEREIRVKYYDSLILEFMVLNQHLDQEERKLQAHLAVIEEIEEGNRPHLPVSDLHFIHRALVVNAAVHGRNFESLDRSTLRNIVGGVSLLEMLDQSIRSLNRLSEALVPVQARGEDCCYDRDGRLLPHLDWYPRLIGEIHTHNRQLRKVLAERAIPDLEAGKAELQESGWL